ncbi:MAG: SRPBCC domain-containing protein [Bacteroidetes bacterium]|nr:SRPBCC domain-containing protein [Bacteroidota bacterium]
METTSDAITIDTTVKSAIEKVWNYWNEPQHIMQWCQASDDWHAPKAESDLKVGGKFTTTMAAKDGSFSFEFGGTYTKVEPNKVVEYTLGDGRKVKIIFSGSGNETKVAETFEPESENTIEIQRAGWQAILDNFKKYTENN